MTDKTQIEQIRDVLEVLRLTDEVYIKGGENAPVSPAQASKIYHISKKTLDALLGLESK